MNATRSEAALRDLEAAPFAKQEVLRGHADAVEIELGVSVRRVVVAEHAKHTKETYARRVDGNQDHRLLPVPVGICSVGLAHEDEDLAARIGTAGRPPFAA